MIEKFKSGFLPPGDIPFEDLSSNDNASINGSMSSMQQSINPVLEKKTSLLGTITGGRIRKRSGILGLFSNAKVKLCLVLILFCLRSSFAFVYYTIKSTKYVPNFETKTLINVS